MKRYLFDSNVFMEGSDVHYRHAFCQLFWDWILAGHQAGVFFSIDKVKKEIMARQDNNDPLKVWAQQPALSGFFLDSINDALKNVGDLSAMARDPSLRYNKSTIKYKESAISPFVKGHLADIWLIAYAAKHTDFVIVTREVPAPLGTNAIKIPDAAEWVNVTVTQPFPVIARHAINNFTFCP
jgi:hypothetical protein